MLAATVVFHCILIKHRENLLCSLDCLIYLTITMWIILKSESCLLPPVTAVCIWRFVFHRVVNFAVLVLLPVVGGGSIHTNVSGKKLNLLALNVYECLFDIWACFSLLLEALWRTAQYRLLSKLVLTFYFLVDCSLPFYAYNDIFLTYIFCYVLGETHWLLNPWA